MINLPTGAAANELPPFAQNANFYLGTVVSRSGSSWKIIFDGTDSETTKYIKAAYGLTYATNARVLVIEISGTFLIIARIP